MFKSELYSFVKVSLLVNNQKLIIIARLSVCKALQNLTMFHPEDTVLISKLSFYKLHELDTNITERRNKLENNSSWEGCQETCLSSDNFCNRVSGPQKSLLWCAALLH